MHNGAGMSPGMPVVDPDGGKMVVCFVSCAFSFRPKGATRNHFLRTSIPCRFFPRPCSCHLVFSVEATCACYHTAIPYCHNTLHRIMPCLVTPRDVLGTEICNCMLHHTSYRKPLHKPYFVDASRPHTPQCCISLRTPQQYLHKG